MIVPAQKGGGEECGFYWGPRCSMVHLQLRMHAPALLRAPAAAPRPAVPLTPAAVERRDGHIRLAGGQHSDVEVPACPNDAGLGAVTCGFEAIINRVGVASNVAVCCSRRQAVVEVVGSKARHARAPAKHAGELPPCPHSLVPRQPQTAHSRACALQHRGDTNGRLRVCTACLHQHLPHSSSPTIALRSNALLRDHSREAWLWPTSCANAFTSHVCTRGIRDAPQ